MSRRLLAVCLLAVCLIASRLITISFFLLLVGFVTSVNENSACAEGSSANEQPRTEQRGNIAYRRMFVPADSPEEWPVGSGRYLPIPRADFARLVEQNQPPAVSQQHLPIHVSSAIYRAKLLSNDVLEGVAEWRVNLRGNQLPNKVARLLPLSPMNLAIQSAFWRGDPTQAAAVGLWKREDNAMEMAVLVNRSDTLRFDWQLAAQRIDSVRTDYTFKIPIVVPQTLELLLPANRSATLSASELLPPNSAPLLPTGSGPMGERRWVFQLAPREIHRLEISQLAPTKATRALPFVSQSTSYQLEPSGLTSVTRLRLDARESPISELKAAVESGLRIIDVTIDQQPVAWRVVDRAGEIRLVIPRAESTQPQAIEIRCLAKLRTGTTWKLPKLRFDEVAWTEGTTSLLVSPDLELSLLTPRQATLQHIVGIAASARAGEVFRLQEWSRDAALEIEVGRPLPSLSARTCTKIEVGHDEAQASLIASLSSSGRDVYQVQATIEAGWSIDSVTTTPKSALNDWHIDRDEKSQKIRFQLNQPVSKQSALRVEVKARKTTAQSVLPATVGQLKLLRFHGADVSHEMLHLGTRDSTQFALADRLESLRLSPDELPLEFSDLLPASLAGTLIDVSHLNDAEVVEFSQQPAEYRANLQIEIDALSAHLQHHYRIECHLQTGAVREIVLELDEPPPEALHWEFVGQRGVITSERIDVPVPEEIPNETIAKSPAKTSVETRIEVPQSNRATYLLRLPKDMAEDFVLQASYSLPAQSIERCNLIHLPQSIDWDGEVILRGLLNGFHVFDQGWTPMVYSNSKAGNGRLPVLGAYRLGSEEFHRPSIKARLRLQRHHQEQPAPQMIAWLAEYHTLQAAGGAAIHVASYSLENLGINEAAIVLPPGAELQEAWIDNQQLEPNQISSEGSIHQFRFENELRWPYLTLKYSTHEHTLEGSASLQPVVPKCSFQINLGRWTLWIPERYEIDKTLQNYSAKRYHWRKRLFGPLARSRGETVFNPVKGDAWAQLWSVPLVGKQTKQVAENLAIQLVNRLETDANQPIGTLLGDVIDQNQITELFYVDRMALLAKGIQAQTSCQELIVSRRARRFNAQALPLSSHPLALLVSPGVIVLTTAERVAHWHDQLRPTDASGIFMVSSDDLADSFDAIRSLRTSEFLSVAQWQKSPRWERPRWINDSALELADVGRRAQTVEFVGQLPSLIVRRAFVQRALWYAIVLLTLVLGVWQLAHYPNRMTLAGAIAAAACLLVPASWLTIPQAIFLGLVAAAILRVAMKSLHFGEARSQVSLKGVPVAVWFLLCCLDPPAHAQPLTNHGTTTLATKNLPLVLFPIDSRGSQQGNDVYLSEEFLTTLRRSPRQVANDGAELVLLTATYRGSLPSGFEGTASAANGGTTDPWTLRWKVKSYLPNSRLVLPLQRDEALWDEKAHRLDGMPIKLNWQSNGNGCSVVLPTIGVHWLQLVAQPRFTTEDLFARLVLHVPPLSGARLDLTLAPNVVDSQVAGAVRTAIASQTTTLSNRAQWQYLHGGARDSIDLRWTSKAVESNSASWERLEQLSWLHVNRVAARLDVQLSVTGLQASSPLLELDVSSQLKLVPPGENSPIEEVISPSPSHPTRLQLKLRRGLPSDFVIPLRFELQRTESVGRIFFPRVRLQGASPDQNLFAVSVSAGLSYDELVSNSLRSIEPVEFSASWDSAGVAPLYAYSLGQEAPEWSLRIWPDPQSLTAQQTLRVHCLPNEAHVDFEASVDGLTGSWLSHRLQVPASLQIDAITIESPIEGNSVPVRWSRSRVSETDVMVFLGRPLQHPHQLKLQGHVNATAESEVELSQVQLHRGEPSEIHMDLYRTEDVQVSWSNPERVPDEIQQQGAPRIGEEIHIGHFTWRSSEAGELSRLRLERNNPKFETTSVTTVDLGPSGWTACLNSRLEVRQGVVSHLSMSVPNGFQAPYVLQPEQVGEIDEVIETASGKEITLRLTEPATEGDQVELQLSGSLNLSADQPVVVPSLQWTGATRRNRFVLLPTLIDGQLVVWRKSGLRRQPLPKQLRVYAAQREATLPFHIEQSQFKAEEGSFRGTLRNALVRYAMVSGIIDEAGLLTATAELVLQPGRATSCKIQLPRQSQLCQLIVGDAPVRREQLEDGCWRVPLGPPFIPQRIVANYRSYHELAGQRLRLVPPSILFGDQALPMPKTWWRIQATRGLQLDTPLVGHLTDEFQFLKESCRLAQLTFDDAKSQASELPREEGQAWFKTWQRVTRRAEEAWQAYNLSEGEESTLLTAQQARLGFVDASATDDPTEHRRQIALTYPPRLSLNLEAPPSGNQLYFVSDSSGQLALTVTPASKKNLWRWFAAVALVCGTLAVVLQLRHDPQWHHRLCHWPHGLAMGSGCVWWLLLKPSSIGMLVIALTLTSLAIKQWRLFRHHRRHKPATQLAAPTS